MKIKTNAFCMATAAMLCLGTSNALADVEVTKEMVRDQSSKSDVAPVPPVNIDFGTAPNQFRLDYGQSAKTAEVLIRESGVVVYQDFTTTVGNTSVNYTISNPKPNALYDIKVKVNGSLRIAQELPVGNEN